MGRTRLGMWTVAVALSLATAASAGELGDTLRANKLKMLRIAGAPMEGKSAGGKNPVVMAHADVLTEGKPVTKSQLEAATAGVRGALEALWPSRLTYVEVELYAPDRLLDRGAPAIRSLSMRTESNSPSGALWTPDDSSIDTRKAVHWYAKVVWFRPYTLRAGEVSDFNAWQFLAWYAEGNAARRPAEGGTDHAPERVK